MQSNIDLTLDIFGKRSNSVQKLRGIGKYLQNQYFFMHKCKTSLRGW